MGLAPFFDKAALAVAGVLPDLEFEVFKSHLEAVTVAVAFDDTAAQSFEGQTTLELAINLLSRLYPTLAIEARGTNSSLFRDHLVSLAKAINPNIEVVADIDRAKIALAVGTTPMSSRFPVLYLGSERWLARLSSATPMPSGSSRIPFGAAAAACIGVANVFREVFHDHLPNAPLDKEVAFSTYMPDGSAAAGSDLAIGSNLGTGALVGVGAIGSAVIWTLARLPGMSGTLHLIDHEPTDSTNPQRYVLLMAEDGAKPKVELACREFDNKGSGLTVIPHQMSYAKYYSRFGNSDLNRVLSALDSADDRILLQASLPRRVLNAWTQDVDVGLSRHDFIGSGACLACLYWPNGTQKSDDAIVLEGLRLPETRLREVRQLLELDSPLDTKFLADVAGALGIAPAELSQFEGHTIRHLYNGFVCSGHLMRLAHDSHGADIQVPLAFQSAFAGVLLAADFVVDALGLRTDSFPDVTRVDLLRPLAPIPSAPEAKHPSGLCICHDEDFIARYRAKWPESVAS